MIIDRRILLAACIALATPTLALNVAAAPDTASTRTNFDGAWSVLIVTDSGQCDRAYRYGVLISAGQVIYQGSAAVNVEGRVTSKGQVNVRVWAGAQRADGSGQISNDYGEGIWQGAGSSGTCSGIWSAERR
jgi:hypothetical protein